MLITVILFSVIACVLAFRAFHFYQTGRVPLQHGRVVYREEDPVNFWILVVGLALGSAVALGSVVALLLGVLH
jgi:hypothetical protein